MHVLVSYCLLPGAAEPTASDLASSAGPSCQVTEPALLPYFPGRPTSHRDTCNVLAESRLSMESCNFGGSKPTVRGCERKGEHAIDTQGPFEGPAASSHALAALLATLPPHPTLQPCQVLGVHHWHQHHSAAIASCTGTPKSLRLSHI